MLDRFVAFDLEMPSNKNRISAIGITVVEKGEVVDRIYYLVNPETEFEPLIIKLIGITPEMVENEPTFPDIWKKVKDVMSSGLLVAHGAPGDMKVLCKCLQHYGIEWQESVQYLCTHQMGLDCYPEFEHHGLDFMCKHIGFDLQHHYALSDSEGCAMLLLDYLRHGIDYSKYIKTYSSVQCKNKKQKANTAIQCQGKGFERRVRTSLLKVSSKKMRNKTISNFPDIDKEKIIGVDEMQLRIIANTLVKRNQKAEFVKLLPHKFHEENNLHALLISKTTKFSRCMDLIENFLPYVDNEETCRLMLPKMFKRKQPELLKQLEVWAVSEHEYTRMYAHLVKTTYFEDTRC